MKFSLVLATVGRFEELKRFLESLGEQREAAFELIVVDQNSDDRLVPLLESYTAQFPLTHLRSERGLSRARNIGLKHITGDIVAFPDDDCWYAPDVCIRVSEFFLRHPNCDGLTGRHALPSGKPSAGWDQRAGWLSMKNVWRRAISFSIFLRKRVVHEVAGFDETLGAGSSGGEGEETDYLLSALRKGLRLYYEPSVLVFHPNLRRYDSQARRKQYSDALGFGRVLRKHNYPLALVLYFMIRPVAGALLKLAIGRPSEALRHWAMFRGRIAGYKSRR